MKTPPFPSRFFWIALALGCDDIGAPSPPPPTQDSQTGILLVISTTGSAPDPDGYLVVLDETTTIPVPAAGQRTVTVREGTHTARVSGLAENCTLFGANPVRFAVAERGLTAVAVQVYCPALASLQVTIASGGVEVDPDGYDLSIDGIERGRLALQADTTFRKLQPGTYQLRLSSVAGNCAVAGGSTKRIDLGEAQAGRLDFVVNCTHSIAGTPGPKFVMASQESDGDSNLYLMELDGSVRQRLTDDADGEYVPELSPDGENVAYVRWDGTQNVLTILNRASGTQRILPTPGVERAVWSPDGSKFAFIRSGKLFLMNADGTGETLLTTGLNWDGDPYWSPDGARLAFTRNRSVWVMNADGGNVRQVSGYLRGAGPWSPDGRYLVVTELACDYFDCYYGPRTVDLRILELATGHEERLTDTPLVAEWSPVWAPDRQQIFFIGASGGNRDIWSIQRDSGQPAINLTHSLDQESWISLGTVGAQAAGVRAATLRRPY